MEYMFTDIMKIKLFSRIQSSLIELEPNCENEQIDKIIDLIPKTYFEEKENLMIICRIFAIYCRTRPRIYRQNAIKLFEKIMHPIKTYLQNQPVFFWTLFGSLNYIKLWMYEEDLITIDVIIESATHYENYTIIEFFLPEIIEKRRELFENEFKNKITTPYSDEYINEFKVLRKKYFTWLRKSNDVNDPIYSEIETNQLRLAIKTDNIDKFQSILSYSNISLEFKIKESFIENSFIANIEQTLLEFAIDWNAIKIIKYLIMNGVKFSPLCSFNSIYNGNYEIIHIVESLNKEDFSQNLLYNAIECWNMELSEYAIENYDFDFIEQENIESDKDENVSKIFCKICHYENFEFFEKIFLPFLKKNPRYVKEKIYSLLIQSFYDHSLYFTNEILKNPEIDLNHQVSNGNDKKSLLTVAIQMNNFYVTELLLNNPLVEFDKQNSDKFFPFHVACICKCYTKILDLFFKKPKFDIYCRDGLNQQTGFVYCVLKNNFFGLQKIKINFPDFKEDLLFNQLLDLSASQDYLTISGLLIKWFINQHKEMSLNEVTCFIKLFLSSSSFDKINPIIIQMYNNIKNNENP